MWLIILEQGQFLRQVSFYGHSSKRKIVLSSVGKPQLGARGGDHSEEVERCRKFLEGPCEEPTGHQMPMVGGAWRKRNCINRGDYVPSGVGHVHSQQKIQICLVVATVVVIVVALG